MRVNVGDIVIAKYMDFDGEIQTAMFAVCYHECYDIKASSNFTGIKISSSPRCYQVLLKKDYLSFLNHDSFLNCNALFRLREDNVLGIVGRFTPYYLNKMLQQTTHYFERMKQQMIQMIGEDKLFTNKEGDE